jgi:hypothetical protein
MRRADVHFPNEAAAYGSRSSKAFVANGRQRPSSRTDASRQDEGQKEIQKRDPADDEDQGRQVSVLSRLSKLETCIAFHAILCDALAALWQHR